MERFQGILGIFVLLGIAYLLSNNRKKIDKKVVIWGLSLQLFFAILILLTPIGKPVFSWFDSAITTLLGFAQKGSDFLFESFVPDVGFHVGLINFAFVALPTVIFFSALMAMFYHYGVMQKIIKLISKIMQKTMGTSGAETTSISSNIFVGQTEAPLVIKPFISKMTQSELMAVMVGGFATVAGGVMAIYVSMVNIDGIAGHLLAASIMSAPAALVIAKIIYPETKETMSSGDIKISIEKHDDNGLEALARGSSDGLKLAGNIAAMLIAFVAFVALVNHLLGYIPIGGVEPLTIEMILGYLFMPLSWTMGAEWGQESQILGSLLGQKLVLTEMIAYGNLSDMIANGEISNRTAIIASYALCGFANFASIGIQLGGIGSIAPERRKDLAKIVFKAMIGGALASWLTASIASIMITEPVIKIAEIPTEFNVDNYMVFDGTDISFSDVTGNKEDGFSAKTYLTISLVDWDFPNGIYDIGENYIDLDSSMSYSVKDIDTIPITFFERDTLVYDSIYEDFTDSYSYKIDDSMSLNLSSVNECNFVDDLEYISISGVISSTCIFSDSNNDQFVTNISFHYDGSIWVLNWILPYDDYILQNNFEWNKILIESDFNINKIDN